MLSILRLYGYIFFHILISTLNPILFYQKLQVTSALFKKGGIRHLKQYFFGIYLPKNYLRKTKFTITSTSGSIYKKVSYFLPDNFFKSPKPNEHNLSVPLKILIIRFGALGDVLFTTPLVRHLYKERNGFVEIYIATRHEEVFKNNPYVTKIFSPSQLRKANINFGLIIDLDNAYQGNKSAHMIDVFSYYAFGLHVNQIDKQIDIHSSDEDKRFVSNYLIGVERPYIVVHNRNDKTHKHKGVNISLWNNLLTHLVNKYNIEVIQIGGINGDVCLNGIPHLTDARNMFSLQQTKELISRSQLFVGIDAGPLHIAAATDVPIISFFTQSFSKCRMPLRTCKEKSFSAIEPKIDCYGCLREYPLPYGFECLRGDSLCSDSFDIDEVLHECESYLKHLL